MKKSDIFNYTQFSDHIATSGQPLAEEFELIAQAGYQVVINLALHNSNDAIATEGYIVTSLGMSYFHIPVLFDAPKVDQLEIFIDLMESLKHKKVWIHCVANFRVSAFMYLYQKKIYKASDKKAKSPIFEFWQPDEIWQKFMELK